MNCPACNHRFSFLYAFRIFNPLKHKCPLCGAMLTIGRNEALVFHGGGAFLGACIAGVAIFMEEQGRWHFQDSLLWFLFAIPALTVPLTILFWRRVQFTIRPDTKPKSSRIVKVGIKVLGVVLGSVGCLIAFYLIYDEPLDPGIDAAYLKAQPTAPDNMNAAIGIAGLSGARGTDFMAHGRFVADTLNDDNLNWTEARMKIEARGVLALSKKPGELDCLLWPEPDNAKITCPTAARLTELEQENAELLKRYRQLSMLPQYQPLRYSYNESLFININRLIAEDIGLELHKGRPEAAYRKWHDNFVFLTKAASADDAWVGKAFLLVSEGFSLSSIELLLHDAPALIDTHGDELLQLLKPAGLSRWNLAGTWRETCQLIDSEIMGIKNQYWVRPNFLRNRCYRAASAFIQASAGRPAELEKNFSEVHKTHGKWDEWSWDYLRNPINTLYARLTLGGNLKAGELVKSMVLHDGKMRLLTLRILLAQRKITDTAVPGFLSSQTSALENPYSDQAMKWDAKNRVIWFCPPGIQAGCPQVRLQGGKWLDDPAMYEEACKKK